MLQGTHAEMKFGVFCWALKLFLGLSRNLRSVGALRTAKGGVALLPPPPWVRPSPYSRGVQQSSLPQPGRAVAIDYFHTGVLSSDHSHSRGVSSDYSHSQRVQRRSLLQARWTRVFDCLFNSRHSAKPGNDLPGNGARTEALTGGMPPS